MTSSSAQTAKFMTLLAAFLAAALAFGDSAEEKALAVGKQLGSDLPGFFGPMTTPTDPIPVQRTIAEWEPAKMLLVSIPTGEALRNQRVFAFYFSLIEAATRYVDVGIARGTADIRQDGLFLDRLRKSGLSEQALNRVHIIPSQAQEYWIRDFGPLFGWGQDGQLIAFDSIYRQLAPEIETWNALPADVSSIDVLDDAQGFQDFVASNRHSDVTPLFVAKFIRQEYQYACEVVRPPLHLQGGDYITDGQGAFFVSNDTILANGGRIKDVELIFRTYFGAQKLVVLNAVPGLAAKHLDLLMNHPAPGTFILTRPPELRENATLLNKRLTQELEELQIRNEKALKKHFPEARILTVPMPPAISENRNLIISKARAQVIASVCEEIGVNYLKYTRLKVSDPQRSLVRRKVSEHLSQSMGKKIDIEDLSTMDPVFQNYLGGDLETLVETNVDLGVVYRSYVNSVQITTPEGQRAWLLPRYRAREGEKSEHFVALEQEVEKVYLSIDPEAKLHWIESDVMADQLGAIHCLAMIIPHAPEPQP